MHQWKIRKNERGQIFALIAVLIGVLVLFVGLAIDFGQAYVTKTTLNKAVDAATLAAMRNLNSGAGYGYCGRGGCFQSQLSIGAGPRDRSDSHRDVVHLLPMHFRQYLRDNKRHHQHQHLLHPRAGLPVRDVERFRQRYRSAQPVGDVAGVGQIGLDEYNGGPRCFQLMSGISFGISTRASTISPKSVSRALRATM